MLKIWLLGAGVAAAIGLLAGTVMYIAGAEEAKAAVITLTEDLEAQKKRTDKAEANAEINSNSFKQCSVINAENAERARVQEERAKAALLWAARLEEQAGRDIEVINREADEIRGKDTVCRTLDQPLPEWLVVGLRQPGTAP